MTKPRSTTSEDPAISVSAAGDQPAGAGFRGRDREPAGPAALQHAGGGAREVVAEVGAGHRGAVGSRMVAVAMAAIPSPRPMKPSFSLVVALTATRSMVTPATAAMRARMASRCGPIARRLADDGDVEMGDAAAALAHALRREGEEAVGARALPLRIAGRKMRADVAVGERAEDGVDQRMERRVGIGIAGEAALMGDAHPAEPDMIAVAERMHVVAGGGADIAERGELRRRDAREILFRGQLDVGALALEHAHLHPRPFRERGIVGEIVAARREGARRCAASSAAKSNACGVCTARSRVAVDGIDHLPGLRRPS